MASFAVCPEQVPGPDLRPENVVVLDNLPTHKADGLADLVAACGARLLHLPPYSLNFTPIEPAFSKRKTHLRAAVARTRKALTSALQAALAWITAEDA
ncbi:MAG: transposase [Janthinobacterium lividum]